jgi:hypothetical protein
VLVAVHCPYRHSEARLRHFPPNGFQRAEESQRHKTGAVEYGYQFTLILYETVYSNSSLGRHISDSIVARCGK